MMNLAIITATMNITYTDIIREALVEAGIRKELFQLLPIFGRTPPSPLAHNEAIHNHR